MFLKINFQIRIILQIHNTLKPNQPNKKKMPYHYFPIQQTLNDNVYKNDIVSVRAPMALSSLTVPFPLLSAHGPGPHFSSVQSPQSLTTDSLSDRSGAVQRAVRFEQILSKLIAYYCNPFPYQVHKYNPHRMVAGRSLQNLLTLVGQNPPTIQKL